MTSIHVSLLAHDYLAASRDEKSFDLRTYLTRDLKRPWFEEYGFCGGYAHYAGGQGAALGLSLPAYITATTVQSIANRKATCVDAAMTPRGQFLTLLFVPFYWFLAGLTCMRLAQRRLRRATTGIRRMALFLGLIPVPLGGLCVLGAILEVFMSISMSARLLGTAFWILYLPTLCAERLRIWPFRKC